MKLILFVSTLFFVFQASASSQTYSGSQARELYKMLKLNPKLVTNISGGGGGTSDGVTFYFETLEMESNTSLLSCTKTTTTKVQKKTVSFSCDLQNR